MWFELKNLLTPRNKKQAIPQFGDPLNENFHEAASPFNIRNGGVEASLTVGTTAVEIKAGTEALRNRRTVSIHPKGDSPIYVGFSNSVSSSTGQPLLPGHTYTFQFDPTKAVAVYLVADSNQDVRIVETN